MDDLDRDLSVWRVQCFSLGFPAACSAALSQLGADNRKLKQRHYEQYRTLTVEQETGMLGEAGFMILMCLF